MKILDYLMVLRPTLLFPVWTLVLIGHYQGFGQVAQQSDVIRLLGRIPIHLRLDSAIQATVCLYSMLMGAVYIINQIADQQTDALNQKLYLVAQGYVKPKFLKIQIALLLGGSITWAIAQFYDNQGYLILIGLSILLGIAYSVRPFRLKGKPILDLLANAIGYGCIPFLIGLATASPLTEAALLRTAPYFFCVAAAFVNTTLPDLKGDSAYGDITTGVFLGQRRSCQFSLILLIGAILAASLLKDPIALVTSLLCLPFFVYMNFNPTRSVIIFATRIGILALSLLTCIVIPFYTLLFVGTLLFVRWYYAARFGIEYPGRST